MQNITNPIHRFPQIFQGRTAFGGWRRLRSLTLMAFLAGLALAIGTRIHEITYAGTFADTGKATLTVSPEYERNTDYPRKSLHQVARSTEAAASAETGFRRGQNWLGTAVRQIRGSAILASVLIYQTSRKPKRAKPPDFSGRELEGVFFDNPFGQLKGDLPRAGQTASGRTPDKPSQENGSADGSEAWHKLISANSIEDLVKGSKLRLDRTLITPAKFLGGGYNEARQEFALQAFLFAIIECYQQDVRWKSSASAARETFARTADNLKIGSQDTYRQAKQRLLELAELLNGISLSGEARTEIQLDELLDRDVIMKLMEWTYQEHVLKLTASEQSFAANNEEITRFSELLAAFAQLLVTEGMPDADDTDYQGHTKKMISEADRIRLAIQSNNAEAARKSAARMGQSCVECHDYFQ